MTAAGDVLGYKYQLVRLLGEGGMGQVFEATNQNTGRRVAIKTLHNQWASDPSAVQRFLREARAATRISHPNVVDVLDLDVDQATGAPYIVQEFLAGESLEAHLDARPDGRLPVDETLGVLVPVMEALVAAHALGIVHRDLKPANIFLTRDRAGAPTPKVIDFGIAKLMETSADSLRQTATGTLVGTPSYMSPEQAAGASDLDARTDVWSLGAVFYELLTGALPYEASNYNLLVAKIVYEEPHHLAARDPSLPRDLVAVVDRALQKNRDARFPTMQALLDATLACDLAAAPTQPRLSAPAPRPSPPPASPTLAGWTTRPDAPPRRSVTVAALSVLAAVLVATAGFLLLRPTPVVTMLAAPVPPPAAVVPPPVVPPPVVPPPVVPPPVVMAPVVTAPVVTAPVTPRVVRRAQPRRPPVRSTSHDFDRGYE